MYCMQAVICTTDDEEFIVDEKIALMIQSLVELPGEPRKYTIAIPSYHVSQVLDILEFETGNMSDINPSNLTELLKISRELRIPRLEEFCLAYESRFVPDVREISFQEVQCHSSRDDCWLVIDNCVYDITSWLPKHPGGDALLQGIGKDSTYYFELYHRTKYSFKMLKKYFIGILSKDDRVAIHPHATPSTSFLERLRATHQ